MDGKLNILSEIQKKIIKACSLAKRDPQEVKLIAVTKKVSIEKMLPIIQAGQIDFAENYLQEALIKIEQLKNEKLIWHFIGQIQTNKLKNIVGNFSLIHSVDRIEVAKEISKISKSKNIIQDILIEVNIGGEESKSGGTVEECYHLIKNILSDPHLRVCGLMCLPPLMENPEELRPYFKEMREIRDRWFYEFKETVLNKHPWFLSMGTSHDFEIAIEEGANWIRLGTLLFGNR